MSFPNRIAIATRGYRCGGNPTKTSIATYGYRCLEPAVDDGLGGGMGHGAVILEPTERIEPESYEEYALLAVLAIQEYYE